MRSLSKYISESVLNNVDKTLASGEDSIKGLIMKFLKENYNGKVEDCIIRNEPDKDGKYIIDHKGGIGAKRQLGTLENDLFKWGKVNEFYCYMNSNIKDLKGAPEECNLFDCTGCKSLKSLEGAPKKCGEFICAECVNLKTLKGAPEECEGFNCADCDSLESLEYSPKKCSKGYICYRCDSLVDLKGAPEKCDHFDCNDCKSLTSLEGAPRECDFLSCYGCTSLMSLEGAPEKCNHFECGRCGGRFTKDHVMKAIKKVNRIGI